MDTENGASIENAVTFPTRQQATERMAQEQVGFYMDLPRTGGHAHVRHLAIADLTTVAGLPTQTQTTVLRVFREIAEASGGAALSWEQLAKNQKRNKEMADAICVIGFIKPRLVMTEAELDGDPHTMLVSELHVTERTRYLNICTGQDEEAAKKLRPFPIEGPRSAPALQALPTPAFALHGVEPR